MTKTGTKLTCSDQKIRTMKISIEVTKDSLLYICETLAFLDNFDSEFASPAHRQIALQTRVLLGPRLFRSALKMPVPEKVSLSEIEARLVDFSLQHYPFNSSLNNRDVRKILGTIQQKLI